jgi:hypothetical protein
LRPWLLDLVHGTGPAASFEKDAARSVPATVGNQSSAAEIFCAAFTASGVNFDFVGNLLAFCQAGKPRPFDRADANKHIVSAIVRLDKAKTLLAVEPLNNTRRHFLLQSITRVTTHAIPFNWSMSLGKSPPAHSKRNSG